MQSHDLSCEPSVDDPNPPDLRTMSDQPSTASSPCEDPHPKDSRKVYTDENKSNHSNRNNSNENHMVRKERPLRACTARAAAAAEAAQRKQKSAKKERPPEALESPPPQQQCGTIVTPLLSPPPPSQLPRWSIRSMWELASILNFLNIFRPLLSIKVEFSAEEFETALITPNSTLGDIHMPLLKAIPPVTRMALGHNTWITVLCKKLKEWWHWVADGELPVVASRGAEVEAYNALNPAVRVVILKALCDIRVEQEDIRNYIDSSIKHGVQVSAFQKERVGGDSYGISYWYEDDLVIGHRLYREIRKVEVKKGKGKRVQPIPNSSYQWETVATNFDEFQNVSEKLFSSKNRTEASLGKKLKIDMLPEIEKIHKKKERLLKKQHREALLLDNMMNVDGLAPGRSLRDRKPVTYTFDDYDRSINEAIKITKRRQPSPEPTVRRELVTKPDTATNGRWDGPSQTPDLVSFDAPSPMSPDYDGADEVRKLEPLDRSNRRRQRPQRYSVNEFVEAISDNEAGFESDDDIVGEVVYDEEYLRKRKRRKKMSSSSEGDEEFHLDEENVEDNDEEEDSLSISENGDEPQRFKKLANHSRRETKFRSADELRSGLRRSRRATKNHINYRQYELSESETESVKPDKLNASYENTEASNSANFSVRTEDSDENDDNLQMRIDEHVEEHHATAVRQHRPPEKSNSPKQDEVEGVKERHFIDLNELVLGSGFDESPRTTVKDEDASNF